MSILADRIHLPINLPPTNIVIIFSNFHLPTLEKPKIIISNSHFHSNTITALSLHSYLYVFIFLIILRYSILNSSPLPTRYPIVTRVLGLAAFRPSARASKGILHTKFTPVYSYSGVGCACIQDTLSSCARLAFRPSARASKGILFTRVVQVRF